MAALNILWIAIFLGLTACGGSAGQLRGDGTGIPDSENPLGGVEEPVGDPDPIGPVLPPPENRKAEVSFSEQGGYDFGTILIGKKVTHSFSILNKGNGAATGLKELGISAPFRYAGGTFPGTDGDCTDLLDPGDRCHFVVEFAPTQDGASVYNLEIQYRDSGETKKLKQGLAGQGVKVSTVTIDSGPEFKFGNHDVETKTVHLLLISNNGGVNATAMNFSGLDRPFSFSGGAFPGDRGTCDKTLVPNTTCTVEVAFQPEAEGMFNDTLVLTYNDGVKQQKVTRSLSGEGNPIKDVDADHGIGVRPGDDPVYIDFAWDTVGEAAKDWNDFSYVGLEFVGANLISTGASDVLDYCPNYNRLNAKGKKFFWIALVSAMAKHESQFKPQSSEVMEGTAGVGNVITRGLMRIDFDRARAHQCAVSQASQLHDPERNLNCAVKILNYWVRNDGFISRKVDGRWRGAARSWESLRDPAEHDDIKKITLDSIVCKIRD